MVTVLFAVLVIGLIGAAVVVASGHGDSMSEEYDDRPDVRIPADRPLTSADLKSVRFTTVLRGYDAAEVDRLLDVLSRQLDEASDPQTPGPA
ncbi:MAG: DivIVA domain-containing protein [Marmoricola sp.]